jgi:hypothetical protein
MEERFPSAGEDDSFRSKERELLDESLDQIHGNILDRIIDGFEFNVGRVITTSEALEVTAFRKVDIHKEGSIVGVISGSQSKEKTNEVKYSLVRQFIQQR